MPTERIFKGNSKPHKLKERPKAPPWRDFKIRPASETPHRGKGYFAREAEIEAVNASILLRRPLLITGQAGTGKSTLAHAIAYELKLDEVLVWPITSRSTLQQGLYSYDAIARLQEKGDVGQDPFGNIGKYLRLGPLGTALATSTEEKPRVVLIDEIDKSDIDLPNDLLHVFETAEFLIPELERLPKEEKYDFVHIATPDRDSAGQPKEHEVERGRVRCTAFPIVVLTSNDERQFPAAFLRRCLQVDIKPPTDLELHKIMENRFGEKHERAKEVVSFFMELRSKAQFATDQLLNAMYLVANGFCDLDEQGKKRLTNNVLRALDGK